MCYRCTTCVVNRLSWGLSSTHAGDDLLTIPFGRASLNRSRRSPMCIASGQTWLDHPPSDQRRVNHRRWSGGGPSPDRQALVGWPRVVDEDEVLDALGGEETAKVIGC